MARMTFEDMGNGVLMAQTETEYIFRVRKVKPYPTKGEKDNFHKVRPGKVSLGADTLSLMVYGPGPRKASSKPETVDWE